jgi:hypothetical protein
MINNLNYKKLMLSIQVIKVKIMLKHPKMLTNKKAKNKFIMIQIKVSKKYIC